MRSFAQVVTLIFKYKYFLLKSYEVKATTFGVSNSIINLCSLISLISIFLLYNIFRIS